jgi:hypothetical protein
MAVLERLPESFKTRIGLNYDALGPEENRSYDDLADPENWVMITEKGKRALEITDCLLRRAGPTRHRICACDRSLDRAWRQPDQLRSVRQRSFGPLSSTSPKLASCFSRTGSSSDVVRPMPDRSLSGQAQTSLVSTPAASRLSGAALLASSQSGLPAE